MSWAGVQPGLQAFTSSQVTLMNMEDALENTGCVCVSSQVSPSRTRCPCRGDQDLSAGWTLSSQWPDLPGRHVSVRGSAGGFKTLVGRKTHFLCSGNNVLTGHTRKV